MERIGLKEASQLLGMSMPQIRVMMQRGLLDIGQAFPPDDNHKYWSYYIYRNKVNKLVGISNE